MYRIVTKEALKPTVILYEIEAPMVARKAQPGQFIILRVDENGERIPITIHDYNREKGTVTIIVQTVGATTEKLSHKQQGEYLHDFVGPLGKPTETEGKKKVCVVGGGVGCAIAYPVLKKFHDCGAEVHAVVGFKSKDVVILEDKFKAVSSVLKVCTDDGSYGQKGLVTEALKQLPLILETVCTKRRTIRIAGDDHPAELVKAKFMKLNSEHIRFVLDCMQENTTKIRNIKQYMKAALFNAPSTIGSYYTSLVSHDMYGGRTIQSARSKGIPDYTCNEGESL